MKKGHKQWQQQTTKPEHNDNNTKKEGIKRHLKERGSEGEKKTKTKKNTED